MPNLSVNEKAILSLYPDRKKFLYAYCFAGNDKLNKKKSLLLKPLKYFVFLANKCGNVCNKNGKCMFTIDEGKSEEIFCFTKTVLLLQGIVLVSNVFFPVKLMTPLWLK